MAPRRSSRLAALQSTNELSSSVKPSAASAEAGAAAFQARKQSRKKPSSATKRSSAAAVTARGAAAAAAAAGAGELKRKRAVGAGKTQVPDRALEFKHVYGVDEAGRGPLTGPSATPLPSLPFTPHPALLPAIPVVPGGQARGFKHVYGVDEAGRGPLAGPVVAAACAVPAGLEIPGLADSKKLTEKQREEIFDAIIGNPDIFYAVDIVGPAEIDRVNILEATMLAMANTIAKVVEDPQSPSPDYVLVDGNRVPKGLPCAAEAVVKGDATCYAIAAASILAKVTRDRLMLKFDRLYPAYDFKQHKGYGTAAHMKALLAHGPCPIHRRSFAPIKDWTVLDEK
ncbi:unnamed protein product [Closterium sp. NIES-64]|nr:unnamed protein product [Closterium sp. NIES-64]